MTLSLYDSFRRQKAEFTPINPQRISVYCCGPTVYAAPHVGNARAAVVADILVSLLRHEYGAENVVYARNFTDIDDKIMAIACEENVHIDVVTDRATNAYLEGLDGLGCARPDMAPRATGYIAPMQDLISTLLERGHAYGAEGHILFDTSSYDAYGALSGLDRDSILAGARVEVAPYKRDAADFVLWKPSDDQDPGWAAPKDWPISGRGRPGWHIECSAMIKSVLGEIIDIHLGGTDLRFPHHENEIAQSCCATQTGDVPLAQFWVHNGMLRFGGEKMSKSVGNIQTPQELLEQWPGEVIRYALLTAQYRQPLEWSVDVLQSAKVQLDRFYRQLDGVEASVVAPSVLAALRDDLNTPLAMAELHNLQKAAAKGDAEAAAVLKASGALLGLLTANPTDWFQGTALKGTTKNGQNDTSQGLSADDIEALIAERKKARANKDFARSDEIRDELAAQGIILEDSAKGVTWRRG